MSEERKAILAAFSRRIADVLEECALTPYVSVAIGYRDDDGAVYCKAVGGGGVEFIVKPVAGEP